MRRRIISQKSSDVIIAKKGTRGAGKNKQGLKLIGYLAKLLTSSNALFAKSSNGELPLFNFY